METIFGCFIFMQYKFQGMIGYLDFSQPGWLWREQTVTSLLFFCGNKHLLEMTSIWLVGTVLWMRFREIEQSPPARRASRHTQKENRNQAEFVPHKLPLKYKAAAQSCEQREKSCCSLQAAAWLEENSHHLSYRVKSPCRKWKERLWHVCPQAPAEHPANGLPCQASWPTGQEWMGQTAGQTNNWSPQDRATAARGTAGGAAPSDTQELFRR